MNRRTPIFLGGLSTRLRTKLLEGGLFCAQEIECLTTEELAHDINVSKPIAERIQQCSRDLIHPSFELPPSSLELLHRSYSYFSTGIAELDQLLGGQGLRSQSIVEWTGSTGTGKSALLIHLLSTTFQHHPSVHAIVVDADGTLPSRLATQLTSSELSRISLYPVSDFMSLCDRLDALHSEPPTLLCIDGFNTHLNLQHKVHRSQAIHTAAKLLRELATRGTCVVLTCRSTSAYAESWQSIASTRLQLTICHPGLSVVLKKSNTDLPHGSCVQFVPPWIT